MHPMRTDVDFEELVEAQHAPLYRFALCLTRNETDSADLVQETFYVWAAKGHQLEDKTKAKSWLFTTLHRAFHAKRRRAVRFPHHELDEVASELSQDPPRLGGQLDWEMVSACLAKVDPVFRAPVSLYYLEDYAYNDIAQILDIPLGTVKSRIARGIMQMQRMLSEPEPKPNGAPLSSKPTLIPLKPKSVR